MTRFKWYRIRVSGDLKAFLRRVKDFRFSAETNSGFLPALEGDSKSNDLRFLWRSSIVTTNFDEFGNRTNNTFRNIEQIAVNFKLDRSILWLRTTDAPRSTRELLNALERAGGLGTSIEAHSFSSKQQLRVLDRCEESRLIGLRGVGASAQHRFVARIDLASKDGLKPEKLSFLKALEFAADQTSYEITEQGMKGQLTFTANSTVRITGTILQFILAQLENELCAD